MSQAFRTASGGRIDRSRRRSRSPSTVRPVEGLSGDTLASALLANGVHLVGRSFKYHRPRGILSAGAEEPNALVTVGAAQARRDAEPARDAGRALRRPRGREPEPLAVARLRCSARVNDLLSPLFPAGFYYKTFMWPRLGPSGLDEALRAADPRELPVSAARRRRPIPTAMRNRFAHCDVLVVGAGPAGLAAALAAARPARASSSATSRRSPADRCSTERATRIDGIPAATGSQRRRGARELVRAWRAAAAHDGVRLFPAQLRRTRRAAHRSSGESASRAARASGCGRCARSEVVLATGAIERPLVFPDNDRPGIMLADAARTYLPPLRRPRRRACGRRDGAATAAIRRRSTCTAAGVDDRGDRRSARERRKARRDAAAQSGHPDRGVGRAGGDVAGARASATYKSAASG